MAGDAARLLAGWADGSEGSIPSRSARRRARRRCRSKTRYLTHAQAKRRLQAVIKRFRLARARVYECRVCGGWHITTWTVAEWENREIDDSREPIGDEA